ncbi:MAG TPA: phage holin family protein [Dongiaceae bacterium]|nr:phage holin family protein [Dongiaceae bacterium]
MGAAKENIHVIHDSGRNPRENGRSVAEILTQMKAELVEFVQTRVTMLRAELREKAQMLKVAVPLAGIAAVLLGTAYMLFTLALVGLVLAAFPQSAYRWFFAFLIVGVFWGILGAAAAYFAMREFQMKSMVPKRTLEVLKGDKIWIQSEVNNRS